MNTAAEVAKNPRSAVLVLDTRRYSMRPGMTLRDGIKHVGLQTEAVLALHEGTLITDDVILKPGMQIQLVAVNCGGNR